MYAGSAKMRTLSTVVAQTVCLSVCLLLDTKPTEPIEMPFGL